MINVTLFIHALMADPGNVSESLLESLKFLVDGGKVNGMMDRLVEEGLAFFFFFSFLRFRINALLRNYVVKRRVKQLVSIRKRTRFHNLGMPYPTLPRKLFPKNLSLRQHRLFRSASSPELHLHPRIPIWLIPEYLSVLPSRTA